MPHVSSLTQHISRLQPDKDAARLCLYNYLKNLCDPSRPVNSGVINAFYKRALSFAHWQENKAALFAETESLLNHFQESNRLTLDLTDLLQVDQFQVIRAENLAHVEPIVRKFVASQVAPNEKFRLLRDSDFRLIAIVLKQDHSLSVTTFDSNLMLKDGELTPLNSDLTMFYTPELQLHPQMIQHIEAGSHSFARFHVGVEGIRGSFVRGYSFQKFASLDGGGLTRYPLLFYPLKRLEQFYVDRSTDQTYNELTAGLEKALHLLSQDEDQGARVAQAALERGRLAQEHIYPDDKLLRLLITNLDKSLALAAGATKRPSLRERIQAQTSEPQLQLEPEGIDLLEKFETRARDTKDEPWPVIRNLPV
ncbi:MAG: hypothetical protein V4692_07655 [Bdellovibrionota bacterium]